MKGIDAEHYLLEVELLRDKVPDFSRYPFCLPAVSKLTSLRLHPAVISHEAEAKRVGVGDGGLTHQRVNHRDLGLFDEPDQDLPCGGKADSSPGDDQRPLR